MWVTILLGVC